MNSGNSGAERRAIARDLPAIKAIAESCDELRREWEHDGGDVSKSRKYSDPPFPVCACGERCYCDERCQEIDWQVGTARSTITARSRPHSETCASGYLYREGS